MAFDFVTSRQNKAHVTAEQAGALNIAIFGNGRYITKYAQGLEVSVASSNKINIAPGALIVDGRFVINERAEQASIAINHSRHASRNAGRGKRPRIYARRPLKRPISSPSADCTCRSERPNANSRARIAYRFRAH